MVTVRTTGDPGALAALLGGEVTGVTRTRVTDGGLELHVQGGDRIVPRIVMAAGHGGFELTDLAISVAGFGAVFLTIGLRNFRRRVLC